MNTTCKNRRGWFWVWIVIAFILGTILGFVAGIGTIIILNARIDYVQ